nr:MAG TPA_asm: hypothetical protein [Caudoviricetes sp.]
MREALLNRHKKARSVAGYRGTGHEKPGEVSGRIS